MFKVFAVLLLSLVAMAQEKSAVVDAPKFDFVVDPATLPKKLKIVALGDFRFTDPIEKKASNPKVRGWIVQKTADEKPDALLVSGDLPRVGSTEADWAVVKKETQPWFDAKLRVYPSLGNHELARGEQKGLENWWNFFPELKGKRWYSVDFGNCAFIAVDTTSVIAAEQEAWLSKLLPAIGEQKDFIFLFMHHPPYTDSTDSDGHSAREQEQKLGAMLEQLQPKIRARMIVIAGHVHNYERFEHNGVTFITSGGGGASPYLFDRSESAKYREPKGVNYHYLTFEIEGTKLSAHMLKVMNPEEESPKFEEKDSFELKAAERAKSGKKIKLLPPKQKTKPIAAPSPEKVG